MKFNVLLISAALLINAPCISHAADVKENLQGKMVDVSMHNKTDYKVKAHLKEHRCMYDINKNRNFDLAPGASAKVRAESKASGGCFLEYSKMVYEFTVALPNISPIRIGECKIVKSKNAYSGSDYKWECAKQQVSDFYFGPTSGSFQLSMEQRR